MAHQQVCMAIRIDNGIFESLATGFLETLANIVQQSQRFLLNDDVFAVLAFGLKPIGLLIAFLDFLVIEISFVVNLQFAELSAGIQHQESSSGG